METVVLIQYLALRVNGPGFVFLPSDVSRGTLKDPIPH